MASLAEKNEKTAEQILAEGGELNKNKAGLEYCLAKNVTLRGKPLCEKGRRQVEDLLCPTLQYKNSVFLSNDNKIQNWNELSDADKDDANYHNFEVQHDLHFITVEKRTTPGVKVATNATYNPQRDYGTSGLDAMGNKVFANARWKGFWRGAIITTTTTATNTTTGVRGVGIYNTREKLKEDPNKAKKDAAEAERQKRYEAEQAEEEAREAAERAEEDEREAAEKAEEEAREAAELAEEEAREAAEAAEEAAEEAREAAEEAAEEAREA
mgnify:CR=1 FL=1